MFIQRSMRNLYTAKRSSYHVFFFSFLPYLCVSVVAPIWLKIIKHEMACYISYVKHQLFKETRSAIMNIFRKKIFSKNGVCTSKIKSCFHNKSVHYSWKLHGKVNYLIKTGVFVGNYLRPSNNYRQSTFNINAVVFGTDNLLRFTKLF